MEQSVKDILADDFWIMPATPEYIDKGVPYITSKNIKNGTIDFSKVNYISQEDYEYISKNRPILVGDILISMIGTLGETAEVKETDGLFYGQNMFLVRIDESKVNKRYFLNFFKSNCVKRALKGKQNQSTQKYLKANHIEDLIIPVPDVTKQELIAKQLDKLTYIITLRTNELKQLDDLIKARFVEMFGDPVSNPYGYDKVALSDLADIKIGPFGSLLHKEDYIDGGHPLLNPSHIVDGKVSPDDKLTISDEKYEELSAYQLKTGDVVMGRRGEMGRCAVVPKDGFLCGTGSMLIRTKGEVTADYIQKIISFPSFKKTIEDMAVGQTMPNLNVPIVSGFQIIKPPMEVQDRYYAFAEQVNKSKVAVQKALDETQMLFDSLMQEYFN